MPDGSATFDPAAAVAAMPAIPTWEAPTLHVGADETPWVTLAEGIEAKMVQVDLNQGLWVNFNRFHPGARVPPHYHSGQVMAVTMAGEWWYEEAPEAVNRPGSYLFEPAMCTHTIRVPEPGQQDGPTVVWFAIWGCNVQLDEAGGLDRVIDARGMLAYYRMLAHAQGADASKLIVVGE